jgi:serine/threonine protein kinase
MDMKSTNILIDSKFRAKISDFGFSQKFQWPRTEFAGSIAYLSPELLRRETACTTASDVYAFGIIVTEIFSRRSPYDGEDIRDVIRQVTERSINKRPFIAPETPASIVQLINDCLDPDPGNRPSAALLDVRLRAIESELNEETLMILQPKSEEQIQALLYQIFPKHVADDLQAGRKPEPQRFDLVTGTLSLFVNNKVEGGSLTNFDLF